MVCGEKFTRKVGVVPQLDCPVLLGQDCPSLATLMSRKQRDQATAVVGHLAEHKWEAQPTTGTG